MILSFSHREWRSHLVMEASKSHLKYIQVDEDNGSIFKFVKEKIKNAKRISIMHETDWIIKCYLNTSQPKKKLLFIFLCFTLCEGHIFTNKQTHDKPSILIGILFPLCQSFCWKIPLIIKGLTLTPYTEISLLS